MPKPYLPGTADFRALQRSREPGRLAYAFVFSLLAHSALLKVSLGDGWQPGFSFPWHDRRAEAPELRVALLPAASLPAEPPPPPASGLAVVATPADLPTAKARSAATAPALEPLPSVIAVTQPEKPTWVVAAAPESPPARVDTPQLESAQETAPRAETVLADVATLAAERQELERAEAARAESARRQAARTAAAEEAARREAVLRAIGRPLDEGAHRPSHASSAPELAEVPRIEVARAAPARPEPARPEPARPEVRPVPADPALAEREARLRALGQELSEAAARREAAAAARQAQSLQPAYTGPRRYRLFGRTDPNAALIRYVETWTRKIELNMTPEVLGPAARQAHTQPMVTVAVRSDGSVESVTFVLSSGVPAIDQAIRQIVDSQAPYPVFPPALALEYDVIEIRRTWRFDLTVRLE